MEKPNATCKNSINIISRIIEGRWAYDAMVKRIANPQPERSFRKERVGLSQHIQLGISVKDAR